MTNQSTIDKLIEMRLTSMSDAFITQMDDPRMKDVPFEDRFGLLVDIEYNNRKSNSLKRLIKGAGFDQPEAYIADINYTSGRKLNRSLIEHHGAPESVHHGCYREREDLHGLRFRYGSLQTAL